MTIEECLERLKTLEVPDNTCWEHVLADLRALLYGESERAAAFLENEADKFKKAKLLSESNLLKSCAEAILATSPGKRGG